MRTKIMFTTILLLSVVIATPAKAEEITDEIQELKRQLQLLQQRIEQLEARQIRQQSEMEEKIVLVVEEKQQQQNEHMEEKINKAVEAKQVEGLPESIKWVENIKLGGDFRYRHETINAEGDDKGARNRNRIRARLRLDAKVNDEWDVIFRLATAEVDTDPGEAGLASGSTSTNVTLTREFKQKNLWLDWAYAKYHPNYIPGLNVLMGKMGSPVLQVGNNQLIWDNDLAWEGGAANYIIPLNEDQALLVNGGGFWLREVDGVDTNADASLWAIQTGLNQKTDDMSVLYGASYYHFGNADKANISSVARGTSPDFDDVYNLVELFTEVGINIYEGFPMAIFASYVNNAGTKSDKDTAWLLGTRLNKAQIPGSWELLYNYREVEADSVSPILDNSDFMGGGTAGRGHKFQAKYQIHKNVQAALTYYLAQRDRPAGNDLDHDILQADIIVKF